MFSSRTSKMKKAISRGAMIGIVVVVIIIIAVGGYLAVLATRSSTTSTTSSTTSTSSSSSTSVTTTSTTSSSSTTSTSVPAYPLSQACVPLTTPITESTSTYTPGSGEPTGPSSTSQLVDESPAAAYDSLDPAKGFFVTDGYFANVFQSLVEYDPYNSTLLVPALATSCTVGGGPLYSGSPNDFTQWNFTMRANTWFSNKDPINAYVAWFSFVREVFANNPDGVGYSNYAEITINTTNPLDVTPQDNVLPDGLQNALANAGLCTVSTTNDGSCVTALNAMLSSFNPTSLTAAQLKVVSYPDQAYVASSATQFTINSIQPYALMLLILPAQWGALVDPTFLDSQTACAGAPCQPLNPAGVEQWNNTDNTYVDTNGMPGSGPYTYGSHAVGNTQLVLNANSNYWAAGVSGLAPNIQPAKIASIEMEFGELPSTYIADFSSNNAQIISPTANEFASFWSSEHSSYPGVSFNAIFQGHGYPLCDLANGINTQYAGPSTGFGYSPVNEQNVRQALVNAVNYTEILDELYSATNPTNSSLLTLGELFIPPVPPGWGPLDNPENIPLYPFNITLAQQEIAAAGTADSFYVTLSNGTKLGDTSGTHFSTIDYAFILPETTFQETLIEIFNAGLANIGLTITPLGLTEAQFEADTVSPTTTPPIVGVGWCADWADPIYQQFFDMGTTVTHQPNWVNNATLNTLLDEIPFETNATLQLQQTVQAYRIFTQLATIIQMPNSETYYMVQPYVQNVVYSPFQFAIYYDMISYS